MPHKAHSCNQHDASPSNALFRDHLQEASATADAETLDSDTDHLNATPLKAITHFVAEPKNKYIASGEYFPGLPSATNKPDGFPEKLKQAWYELNHEQRELLWLYIAEELTCAQIAERKQQSRTSIRRALSNAYAQLLLQVDYV